jgi:thiamine biosynthesis lipoprotein
LLDGYPSEAPTWERSQLTHEIAAAERPALGTVTRVVVWPAERLEAVEAVVDADLDRLDRAASRFRPDSDISRTARPGDGVFIVGSLLAEAIKVALVAASWTDGRVVPTAGAALVAYGYDRDFALVASGDEEQARLPDPAPLPDWRSVRIDGALLRMPPGTVLDLGATAKALGADRAARAARAVLGESGGVLVSLGGDLAVAGTAPEGGWPLVVGEHRPGSEPPPADGEAVRLAGGGLATSSIVQRAWRRGGRRLHHIFDPSTGLPVEGPWRTATVHASTCVEANAASTAAIVAGEEAVSWLEGEGLAARLVGSGGGVRYVGDWPAGGGTLPEARCSNRAW